MDLGIIKIRIDKILNCSIYLAVNSNRVMQNNYSISTGYSLDTDRYDASIVFNNHVIAEMYLKERSDEIMIEFNNEFISQQSYNLEDFIGVIKEAKEKFSEYLGAIPH